MKTIKTLFAIMTVIIICSSCMKTIISPATDSSFIATTPVVDSLVQHNDITNETDTLPPGKLIYLTIDDAPLNGSRYIDSVILSMKVKTNIFLVGNTIHGSQRFKRYYQTLEENPFIEIYNHSYSHANHKYAKYYQSPDLVLDDFEKNRKEFNLPHQIARLPGRNLWQLGERKKNYTQTGATSAGLLAEKGYKIFGWDVEWKYDAANYTPEQTIDELMEEIESMYNSGSFTSNHVVLLMHDQMFGKRTEKNDLAKLIEKLKASGYTFEYLSKYPDIAAK